MKKPIDYLFSGCIVEASTGVRLLYIDNYCGHKVFISRRSFYDLKDFNDNLESHNLKIVKIYKGKLCNCRGLVDIQSVKKSDVLYPEEKVLELTLKDIAKKYQVNAVKIIDEESNN